MWNSKMPLLEIRVVVNWLMNEQFEDHGPRKLPTFCWKLK